MVGKEKYSLTRGLVEVGYSIDDIWEAGQNQASWGGALQTGKLDHRGWGPARLISKAFGSDLTGLLICN